MQAKDQEEALLPGLGRSTNLMGSGPLKVSNDLPDRDGWKLRPPRLPNLAQREARSSPCWSTTLALFGLVVLEDMSDAVGEKSVRLLALIYGRLLPKGYTRETFAGKSEFPGLGPVSRSSLPSSSGDKRFSECPGVALGLVQDGKIVFAYGFGTKELGWQTGLMATRSS